MLKGLNENLCAFLVFLLIAVIYLHPFFLGKVDTPIDIRNAMMYPWRHHYVDTKVKKTPIWEYVPQNEKAAFDKTSGSSFFRLVPKPKEEEKVEFTFDIDEMLLIKLSNKKDINAFLTFDFKLVNYKEGESAYGLKLVNKLTGKGEKIPFSFKETDLLSSESNKWFSVYARLSELKSIKDLSIYKLEIVAKNPSIDRNVAVHLKNLMIVSEDYTNAASVKNPYLSELVEWYTPAREFFSKSLKSGQLPFWNNGNLSGNEFLADSRLAFFHPLYILFYFIFDHFTAHGLITFISFVLCGFGIFLLTKMWGFDFYCSLFTGIVYMFNPFNVKFLSFEHVLITCATLPFLLIFYEKNIRDPRLLNKDLLTSTVLLGLIFLSGEVNIVVYSAIFFFLFSLFRAFSKSNFYKSSYLKHIFSMTFVFSFALILSQITLLPYFSLIKDSFKIENPEDFLSLTSVPIKAFGSLFFPYYFGFPKLSPGGETNLDTLLLSGFLRNYIYFGFLPLLFSLYCLKNFLKDRMIQFFVFLILFSVIVSIGSPVYYLFKYFTFGFKYLRVYDFLALFSLSVPFLAGIGFKLAFSEAGFVSKNIKILLAWALIFISVIDLMYFSSYFLTWQNRKTYKVINKDGALSFLLERKKESGEPFRVMPQIDYSALGSAFKMDIAKPNTLLPYGIEELSGNSNLISKDLYSLFVYIQTKLTPSQYGNKYLGNFLDYKSPYPLFNYESKILDLLNIKYFILPPDFLIKENEGIKKVYEGDSTVYENTNYLPRAFVVPDFRIINSTDNLLLLLDNEKFDPKRIVLLSLDLPINFQGLNETALKYNLSFTEYENHKINLKVNVNCPSFLVLGNNLNENWKVKMNGNESKHFKANLVQRAVFLPKAGDYLVEFYYHPVLFLKGLFYSIVAFLILLGLVVYLVLRDKRKLQVKKEITLQKDKKIKVGV